MRDFRDSMFSINVNNLNPVVDSACLWGVFKVFGRVRDVFLSSKNGGRMSFYAFIMFNTLEEANRKQRKVDRKSVLNKDVDQKSSSFEEVVKGARRRDTIAWLIERLSPTTVVGLAERSKVAVLSIGQLERPTGCIGLEAEGAFGGLISFWDECVFTVKACVLNKGRGFQGGNKVRFWCKIKIGLVPLKEAFPRVFVLAIKKEGVVKEFGHWVGHRWAWEVKLRR
ncbi:hypothetical protein Dsin_008124 [Dipteronia sinensis]|uniref:RRM domain-containing protein n=1 Tax=Dipteronia sinensis TaxID=43782 RepID=A0AAE0EHR6_9ROSI|nr:hypothetical protein Dsin_008124 [Dipteronia sinensis]